MIRKWNNFKLYLRERLRITSRIEVTYPGKYLVKRRKYEDFVTTKNFENKIELKMKKDFENLKNQPDVSKLNLTELEKYRADLIKTENEEKNLDVNNKMMIQGIE